MEIGNTLICLDPEKDKIDPEMYDFGLSGIELQGLISKGILKVHNEYVIEKFDYSNVTKGDGPSSQKYWLKVKLKGVKDLLWARFFKLK